MISRKDVLMENDRYSGKSVSVAMPHTKEKDFKCNVTNNNDHNYLHKKFKKMASTVSTPTQNHRNESNISYKDIDVANTATNSSISNGSIAAAHPEIEKVKKLWLENLQPGKDVQINYSEANDKFNELRVIISGETSISEEFSLKTDNNENDFVKDVQSSGSGGRYICPYCKLSCAKPSVLQKHIRAHTNERPYPCVPCGFAFKTKSNLYKHRRSRTHALRLQGNDVSSPLEDEWSAGSESDNSLPAASTTDNFDGHIPLDINRPNEFSSPELANDCITSPSISRQTTTDSSKLKSIYKPKFRAAFYLDQDDRQRKPFSPNADFLNEHISKIISDNEAIVDVIETPLQKKYGKIKQIAESKQLNANFENKTEVIPLNLTKSSENDNGFRKRSHSESFSIHNQKHPLNPEGSIIKDLLLKTKASNNGLTPLTAEMLDSISPPYICPLCQIPYRSADNLEVHRAYYCKGIISNNIQVAQSAKEVKTLKMDNISYNRSNSINVRMPEMGTLNTNSSPPLRINKPENLVIIKPEQTEIAAPLPSPGPLLGNTRLVDSRVPAEHTRKPESLKSLPTQSPKRRLERNDSYSPRNMDNMSPRPVDMYLQSKIRCLEPSSIRQMDDYSNSRPNSNSLQMFGGEVKILDYTGGTTTLRIEPSKNQLSPILIQSNMSPSKLGTEVESSSVVVRSGLHSGGTLVHNIPTPKENSTPKSSRLHNTHFQFPPLSAITAFNPLTLPLRPALSPSGTSSILHGGKFIPHVPGMPGPNTSDVYIGNSNVSNRKTSQDSVLEINKEITMSSSQTKAAIISKLDGHLTRNDTRGKSTLDLHTGIKNNSTVPIIKVEESSNTSSKAAAAKVAYGKVEANIKRTVDAPLKIITKDCHDKLVDKINANTVSKNVDNKTVNDIRQFNFENLITKAEIYNNQLSNIEINKSNSDYIDKSIRNERSETSYFQKNCSTKSGQDDRKSKFLRPSTLPLKPGTFTPKRHHGITPNANTMPLVSPETPRPAKAYGQLYLNGNAYTYLGLKCSTKVFYCTINRPQPTYVPNQHFLSMYSNWQLLSELTPDPLGLSASSAMSLYDSRHRPQNVTIATLKLDLILTHSSQWKENKQEITDVKMIDDDKNSQDNNSVPKKELTGGFESNEEYTYVRGRGRGRYVCSECGIRCKKPSMLKKHIRTHTDVRPYTCTHCAFSFKTKGNLTKHMKSKAHYKKCCELGINPNEGNEMEIGENTQGSGETDEETESDGDEGNEGETESSDTETCRSRLPEHEAAHCLLSLGGTRLTSSTPCFLTSARPSTYPYTPALDTIPTEQVPITDKRIPNQANEETKMDIDNEPMDLSRSDFKSNARVTEIPTAHETSVLASLASNTAKLPHHQNQWTNGEPMLHAYLTERALLDSKIKQSQLTSNLSKLKQIESEDAIFKEKSDVSNDSNNKNTTTVENNTLTSTTVKDLSTTRTTQPKPAIKKEIPKLLHSTTIVSKPETEPKVIRSQNETTHNTENAKFVVSEYLKHAKVNSFSENHQFNKDGFADGTANSIEDSGKLDDGSNSDNDTKKMHVINHDLVAQKVVIGAGGVAFKVSKGKEFEQSPSYTPGKLMEDGRRVCDFCNKTFTKPSQLKIHLNIHYMERPFKCSACAVSFRTRGHLQKHERSGSHHNKVSMTSTFGAATSLNPRPFRCSDCNIAFRIHGHLAKHLRSKMHVMKLECLFKLPFGTFTEIERAGVSLTDIDTTDCASSLSSLQVLAQKLHEKDPSKLEYRDPSAIGAPPSGRESSDEEDGICDRVSESDKESDTRTTSENVSNDSRITYSATDN